MSQTSEQGSDIRICAVGDEVTLRGRQVGNGARCAWQVGATKDGTTSRLAGSADGWRWGWRRGRVKRLSLSR